MNADKYADKYKSAIDSVHFSPDFEINLKRQLRGETLIKMSANTSRNKSPIRAIALAGMSIAACFICFIAVKTASERLDTGLVSEPAVTSIETEINTSIINETGTMPGAPRTFNFYAVPAPAAESSPDSTAEEAPAGGAAPDQHLYGAYGISETTLQDTGSGTYASGTYRPEVALEGLLSAFDSGSAAVSYETAETAADADADTAATNSGEKPEADDSTDIAEDAEESVTITVTTQTLSTDEGIRTFLERVVAAGEETSFSEHGAGAEQCRINITGDDKTLLYSVWVFDNCVLVERFAPDGLMKCYVELG